MRSQPMRRSIAAPVDLRSVPPMSLGVGKGRRIAVCRTGVGVRNIWILPRGIWASLAYEHGRLVPIIAGRQYYLELLSPYRRAVVEPIVSLKLNPRSGQKVQCRCRLKTCRAGTPR